MNDEQNKKLKFHFSGICGAGMGNVAMLLKSLGHDVVGSDQKAFPPMSTMLAQEGIEIFEGYSAENIRSPDVQVIANALSRDNVECKVAQEAEWKMLSFPEVIEQYILPGRDSYVVAGTHGKTTTSSILAKMLEPLDAGSLIGGIMKTGEPGCRLGKKNSPFVLEGDEYDTAWFDKHSKFLHYCPKFLILTHLEWDHVDIFPEFENMIQEFRSLLELMPDDGCVLYCGDVPELVDLMKGYKGKSLSYGFSDQCDWQCIRHERKGGMTHMTLLNEKKEYQCEVELFGKLYLLNVLAAFAMVKESTDLEVEQISQQVRNFTGAKRRLELLREEGFMLFSDFAHHPTAIEATLTAMKDEFPTKSLTALFDPRNATSRRNIFEDQLVKSFELADQVVIAPPHPDKRLNDSEKLNAKELAARIGDRAVGFDDKNSFLEHVGHSVKVDEIVVVMSCGDCYGVIPFLEELSV